jgi:hypothetical protein
MRPLQIVLEYLLLAAFAIARPLFVLQALALGTAAVATLVVAGGAWPDWLIRAAVSGAALSVTLLITGLLLSKARGWEERERSIEHDAATWPVPLGLTLILIAGLAAYGASPLVAFWCEIFVRLNGNVDWNDLSRPAPNAGLILLPILAALMVPALVTVTALAAIALPLAILVLLPNRRPRLLALVAMSAVCLAGLALAGWLAARTLAASVDAAAVLMRDLGDAEVMQVAEQLTQGSTVVTRTALYLFVPAAGLVAWVAGLQPWRGE